MLSRAAVVAVVLALAALGPAVAWGQSAGDEQYQDPFAGQGGGSSGGGSSGTSTPAPQAAPTSAPAPAAAATAAPAAPQRAELPRTGGHPLAIALGGLGLVIAGVALRLRLRADGDPGR